MRFATGQDQTLRLVAIIDDNDAMQDSLRDLIESAGFEAKCFGSAAAFLDSDLRDKAVSLIIDILMPKMSGLELQARLKEQKCQVPMIFITAHEDVSLRTQAMREGALECLAKPLDHRLLLKTLRAVVDTQTMPAMHSSVHPVFQS